MDESSVGNIYLKIQFKSLKKLLMVLFSKMKWIGLVVALGISARSIGQIDVGLNPGLFQALHADEIKGLFGAEISAKYMVTENVRTGVNVGIYRGNENVDKLIWKTNISPISIIGERLFLEGKIQPYAGAHIGLLHIKQEIGEERNSETFFAFTPVAGIHFGITEDFGADINAKYAYSFFRNEYSGAIQTFPSFSLGLGCFYRFQYR